MMLAAPLNPIDTVTAASASKSSQDVLSSHNIIRSIGFRDCATDPLTNNIKLSHLALLYDAESNTISLKVDGTADKEFDAGTAQILLTAYDRVVYDESVDMAKVALFIPSQLFSFPAVEALAMIKLLDLQGSTLLCASVPLTNTVSAHSPVITIASVSLTAATIALTAVTSLVASFSSAALLTSMPLAANAGGGPAAGANGLSPSVWDVVSFCQFIAISGSLNLDYPELLQQWTQNFGWSMGLVQAEGWNKVIEGLRASTRKTLGDSSETNENNQEEDMTPVAKQSFTLVPNETSLGGGSGDRILVSESIGGASTHHLAGGSTTTALSMDSMVDGAVKSFVEQQRAAGISNPQNQTEEQMLAMAKKMEPAKLLSILSKHDVYHSTITRRQDPAPPVAAPSVPASISRQPLSGDGVLPSDQDMSLMHRLGELAKLPASEKSPTLTPPPSSPDASPSAPPAWPQGNYHQTTEPLSPHGGLASFGQRLNIPAQNLFMTSLILFCLLLLSASILALVLRLGLEGYATYYRPGKFTKLRRRFSSYYFGNMLRVVLLAYFAVATMAFYQLTRQDSWVIQTLAGMTLLGFVILATWVTLRLRRAGGTSLFFDERLKARYGVLYDQYVVSAYWFFIPVLAYQVLKAAIVGLGQGSPSASTSSQESDSWAQTSLLLLVEVAFAASVIWKHPFSNKTPNRLNAALGCVRVLNVILLAVLIQGTGKISMVSKTVIGVLITAMQVVMILVLATLVGVQLSKALWGLYKAVKASRENKPEKEKHESLIASLKHRKSKKEKNGLENGDDDSEDEYGIKKGRRAGEHERGGEKSMASLVGMMGIGSNPTIRCTPASDDEDSEDDIEDEDEWNRDRQSLTHSKRSSLESRSSIRDSMQSGDSNSSRILDYYHPAYLSSSPRASQGSKEEYDPYNDHAEVPASQAYSNRLSIPISESTPTVLSDIWVQAQYMTRRHSESNALDNTMPSVNDKGLRHHHSSPHSLLQFQQDQERRRPHSVISQVRRSVLEPATFVAPALHSPDFNQVGGSSSARSERRGSGQSYRSYRTLQRDSMPFFQSTLLPATLMAGPPPPSIMQPRRSSVSSATLTTPPSFSPVLRMGDAKFGPRRSDSVQSVAMFSPTQVCSSFGNSPSQQQAESIVSASPDSSQSGSPLPVIPVRSSSVSSLRNNFSQYRFPDEGPMSIPTEPPVVEASRAGSATPSRRTVADVQRTIHPLSPFHPDYQHPDDLYKPSKPSPNEMGPTGYFPPNTIQDGSMEAKRDHRAQAIAPPASTKGPATPSALSSKRLPPKLRIDTRRPEVAPPPQIPMPILPPTPLSTSLFLPVASDQTRTTVQSQEGMPSKKDKSLPAEINSTTVTLATPQSSNLVQCSLLTAAENSRAGAASAKGFSPPARQRALTATPLSSPGRPLTVSKSHRS
ncbi:hypothetical protein EMPS_05566 [Entomortierella parvispora]|uniref:TRP C-terminal domain-containing protein n=1 Tax=Entomortierella parvispora TaxID=205924 RepID=A0A9P3LWM1_9FUNG|nr:hypothetical protein EMPS_05566 [Entomortierella parvispora]